MLECWVKCIILISLNIKKLGYDDDDDNDDDDDDDGDDDDIVTAILKLITALYIQTYQPAVWSGRNVINSQNLLLKIPLKLSTLGSVLLVYSLLFFSDFILLPCVSVNSTEFFFFNRPKQKLQQLNKVPKEKP